MARIRTIKPEFWSHPIMQKQDDPTKLMAIALLNFADDEGFFHAEPNIVRGFCRPFDDNSTITRRCLDNLSKIEYISVCENDFYGPIGLVEKFSEHQKIDRPTPSKLKQYYSTNPRRILDEPSSPERKGKERKYYLLIFDEFRKIYPGKKRGNETEFENFIKKQKNYEFVIDLLKPAIENQIKEHEELKSKGKWVPEWANLQTWINQKRWEMVNEAELSPKQEPQMYYIDPKTGNKKPLIKKS